MLTLHSSYYCWWLKGYLQANEGAAPTAAQWTIIVDQLKHVKRAPEAPFGDYGLPPPRSPSSQPHVAGITYC